MPSETDAANDALGMIGQSAITNMGDGSISGNRCLQFYVPLRDGRLRSHHWNFALKWVQLAPDAITPLGGFAYAYTLPPECLKVVNYGGAMPTMPLTYIDASIRNVATYKIEGRKLLSNDATAYLHYLRQVTNPDEWDPLFYQGFTRELASKLAMAIPKDPKLSMALLQQAEAYYATAMAVDGQEGSIEGYVVDDLIWGR